MNSIIKRLARRLSPSLCALLDNFATLAFNHGQWRSMKCRMVVDSNGIAVPWYTYPAIEYLNSFDFKCCDVFEFGSGNSSAYWARRARSVVSVEDDPTWFERTNETLGPNQTLLSRPDEKGYVMSLAEQGRLFDIIVVDGSWRTPCTQQAIDFLAAGGMVLLDNSDRNLEKECCSLLRAAGFIQIDFSGFGPINGYCWTTSIFLKNGLLQQRNFAGPSPVGGLPQLQESVRNIESRAPAKGDTPLESHF